MYFLKWKDEYKTNVTLVDNQHMELFKCYNRALSTYFDDYEKSYKKMIEQLYNYSYYHFKTEELVYQSFGLECKEHKKKHNNFIDYIGNLRTKKMDKQIDLAALNYVRDWLIDHILIEDAQMFQQLDLKTKVDKILLDVQLYWNYWTLKIIPKKIENSVLFQ